jgi:hypothetical protein
MDVRTRVILRALAELLGNYGAEMFVDSAGVIVLDTGLYETPLPPVLCGESAQKLVDDAVSSKT